MNKQILSLALAAAALTAAADVLTPSQALERIGAEGSEVPAAMRKAARKGQLLPARTVMSDGQPGVYLFTPSDGPMMLLSAESDAPALLGYADEYTPGASIPPALEYMMDYYAAQISDLRAGLFRAPAEASAKATDFEPIAPICKTKWNQGAPYNAMCPTDANGRSVTGCVATAMAQVLKTYEYPVTCTGGTFSYEWGDETLSMNFDEVTFDWAAMKDTYTESESAPAVALLMKACGYSVSMNYSSSASGAQSLNVGPALVRNFGFNLTLARMQREWFTIDQWNNLIYTELTKGHALYLDGCNPDYSGAHAFVVDGYRSDGFFHLNWGWGGMSDGYFLLSALDPSSQGIGGSSAGYDRGLVAIVNLEEGNTEAKNAPLLYATIEGVQLTASTTTAKLGASVVFTLKESNGNTACAYNRGCVTTPRVQMALKFTNLATGESTYKASGTNVNNLPIFYGYYAYMTAPLTVKLLPSDGQYEVSVAAYNPYSKEYYDVYSPLGTPSSLNLELKDGEITITEKTAARVDVTSIAAPATIYQGAPFTVTSTLENPTSEPYFQTLKVCLCKKGSSTITETLGYFMAEVAPGSVEITAAAKVPESTAVGAYELRVFDVYDVDLTSAPAAVTVDEKLPDVAPKVSRIQVTDKSRNHLTFVFTVRVTDGVFSNSVYAMLTRRNETKIISSFRSPAVTVTPESAEKVTIIGDFTEGVPGEKYTVYPFFVNTSNQLVQATGNTVTFVLGEDASSISEVEVSGGDCEVEFFDLNGRKISNPSGGLYIRREGEKTSKVLK